MKSIMTCRTYGTLCIEMSNIPPARKAAVITQNSLSTVNFSVLHRRPCAQFGVFTSDLYATKEVCCFNKVVKNVACFSIQSVLRMPHVKLVGLKFDVCARYDVIQVACLKSCGKSWRVNFSSRASAPQMDYYAVLEVNRKATHEEIKRAYYKLSKIYHPDRNKGSAEASIKFHAVSTAYEVLGNYKLRKMYDKGFLTAQYMPEAIKKEDEEPVEHEAFYRSRSQRSNIPEVQEKSSSFNVDNWTKHHYDKQRVEHSKAKERFEEKRRVKQVGEFKTNLEYLMLFGVVITCALFYIQFLHPSTPKK